MDNGSLLLEVDSPTALQKKYLLEVLKFNLEAFALTSLLIHLQAKCSKAIHKIQLDLVLPLKIVL
jgi:hypothetical protein